MLSISSERFRKAGTQLSAPLALCTDRRFVATRRLPAPITVASNEDFSIALCRRDVSDPVTARLNYAPVATAARIYYLTEKLPVLRVPWNDRK